MSGPRAGALQARTASIRSGAMPRLLPLPLLLIAAACGSDAGAPDEQGATAVIGEAEPAAGPDGAERIACATGADAFAPVCVVERTSTKDGLALTLRAPNGGFRRLLVTKDGRGVIAADGAEPARVIPLGPDQIEVAIGADRYRLPATVRQPAGQ